MYIKTLLAVCTALPSALLPLFLHSCRQINSPAAPAQTHCGVG